MTPAAAARAYASAAQSTQFRAADVVKTGAELEFGAVLADHMAAFAPNMAPNMTQGPAAVTPTPGVAPANIGTGTDFGAMLANHIGDIRAQGHASEQASMGAMVGNTDAVSLVTAVAETELAFETMVSVRDKVISAYEEIMRMPI